MNKQGCLYVVATPIGNLGDISRRAIETLKTVSYIAAEDTRHSQRLLTEIEISKKPMIALHEHNEREKVEIFIKYLEQGESIALISDAGTPLISDPGYHLVKALQEAGFRVIPIPGPCALITALSVSGLPSDRFVFEGFLPAKAVARRKRLESLFLDTRTLIFYEAPHRLIECLEDMQTCLGEDREAVIARELTKTFETLRRAPLKDLLDWVRTDSHQTRGEVVLLVRGKAEKTLEEMESDVIDAEALSLLKILLSELSLSQASSLAAKITKMPKRKLYDLGLKIKPK